MIELRNLTKSFPGKHGRHVVLNNVSVTLPEGKSVGIIGRNGAGKTTLLRILGGMEVPDSGEVITNKSISWPLGLKAGGHAKLTGRDIARFVCEIYHDDPATREEKVEWIKDFSELGKHYENLSGTYSSGMHARLGFAISMAFDFDYYLIDETTSVGDRFFRQKSVEALNEKRKRSCVLMVSHGIKKLPDYCDMGLLIENAQVRIFPKIEEAIEAYERL